MLKFSGRKLILGTALAVSALTAAAPAAAQYYPQAQQGYGYSQGYTQPYQNNGYGQRYGYANNWGQARALMARVDQVRQQVRILDRRNILSQREAYRLDAEAQQLRYRIAQLSRGGINQNERYDVERRLARLERSVQINAYDRNGRYDNGRYNYDGRGTGFGGNNGWNNGDHDGDRHDHDRDDDDD